MTLLNRIVERASARKGKLSRNGTAQGTAAPPACEPVLNTRRMDTVESLPVDWLWEGRVPRKMITILDGDPSLGKSTICIDLGARLSAGRPMPGSNLPVEAAAVAFICTEDSAEHTVRPRLEAAGADLTRCYILDTVNTGDGERPIVLPNDTPFIEQFCMEHGVEVLFLDPLFGCISGELDTHKDQSVRQMLHALKLFAEKTGAAVIALRHLNKSNNGSALYRGGGSIAITASARSVLSVGLNPDRPDEKVLAVAKCNLTKMPKALTYELESVVVGKAEVARVKWGEESDLTADDIVTRPPTGGGTYAEARERAEEFLLRELRTGPKPSAELIDKANADGIKKGSLFNARSKLGVKATKEGFSGRWVWELSAPAEESAPGGGG